MDKYKKYDRPYSESVDSFTGLSPGWNIYVDGVSTGSGLPISLLSRFPDIDAVPVVPLFASGFEAWG
jgi:hypothetical protein